MSGFISLSLFFRVVSRVSSTLFYEGWIWENPLQFGCIITKL